MRCARLWKQSYLTSMKLIGLYPKPNASNTSFEHADDGKAASLEENLSSGKSSLSPGLPERPSSRLEVNTVSPYSDSPPMTYPPSNSQSGPSVSSTPLRTTLLTNLTSQTQTLQYLFHELSLPTPNPQRITSLYSSLQASTTDLEGLVKEVWRHQRRWRELERKKEEVLGLERRVRALIMGLEEGRRELERMVEEGKEVRKGIERVENGESIDLIAT
jgi:hypothetical protein